MFDGYIVTCTSAHITTYDGQTRQECVGQQGMIGIDTAMFDSYYSSKTTTSTSKTTTTSATPTYTEAYWIAQGYQYKRNDPDGDWTIYWMTFHSDSGDTSKQPDWCEKSVQKSKLGSNYELVNSKKTPKSISYKKSSDKDIQSCEYSNKDNSLDGTFTCTASDHIIHAGCTGEFPKSFIENWCKDTLWIYTPTAVCLIGPDDHGK
ncbi:uncharacterized protein N7459_007634 [Penicillium hispanicum]|uniref:uncharacterized protein n=1 Tax=Penicillium hispanicum TaxID=1080232 RepID=UPI00253FA482|nr:uncharacterized protein N7459_007634 [Penicillium hispanicum]KAJ5578670.1 hypothetical protein N7459_007634 [Penicillium hispanicum]